MVRSEFPEIDLETSRFITHGWDHFILKTKDKKIFRTPKDDRYCLKFRNEIKLLHCLSPRLNLGVPQYKYISESGKFAGYDLLEGKEISQNTFKGLSKKDKFLIVDELAGFLSQLHNIPTDKLDDLCVEVVDNDTEFKNLNKRISKVLFPLLQPDEQKLIKIYLKKLKETFEHSYEKVLIHNDLSGEHILWDKKSNKVNVIDFSDRGIGDPALDFTGFFEFGDEFPQMIYDKYKGKKDISFLYRAKLYFQKIPLYIMMDSQEGYPCTFEEGYEMFEKLYK
ncbi:MAG: phosphotransferase [Candidatus Delongbacteria bacterium]|nr:phosphotransferase [Candidatus Delongbacteria bacterium]